MSKPEKDQQAESIRHRLRNLLRKRNEDMQFGLQRYAIERFLYRLGVSSHRDRFVLKGASLFALWGGSVYRPTRDLDFTGYGSTDEADVLAALREICMLSNPADELIFDPDTLNAEPIRDDSEYSGVRIRLAATLGTSRIPIQIDIGFGNAVEPPPQYADYPTLLDDPKPRIRTYPPEAVIAEKLHAMVVLGERNSRYKDFYDLHVLAQQFRFDGKTLARAIAATFERRQTPITAAIPTSLTPRFFADEARAQQWRAYVTRNSLPAVPADFDSVGELIRQFLGPAWTALAENITFASNWPSGGPWNSENREDEISTATPASHSLTSHGQQHSHNSDTARIEDIEISIATPLRRFKPYPAYKDSGVEWLGQIPAYWETKALKRVVTLRAGVSITSESIEEVGDYPVFGGNGLRGYTSSYTHEGNFPLIGRQGALCGCVNFASGKFWASEHAIVASPTDEVDPYWLAYLFRSMSLNSYSVSAAQPGLAVETIASLRVPALRLPEQRAIAAFLDGETVKIDALVAKKERLIELLQEKRAALITRTVTQGLDPNAPMKDSGVEWLGDIPKHWEITRLRYACSLLRDGTHQPPSRVLEGYPLLSVRNIVKGQLIRLPDDSMISKDDFRALNKSFSVRENDVLLAIVGATLGKVAVVGPMEPFVIQRSLAILRPRADVLTYSFLAFFLQSRHFQNLLWESIGYSAQPGIYLNSLAAFHIAVPPIQEQMKIVEFLFEEVAKHDRLIAGVSDGIERLKELRTALISAAVTGKIDVREEPA